MKILSVGSSSNLDLGVGESVKILNRPHWHKLKVFPLFEQGRGMLEVGVIGLDWSFDVHGLPLASVLGFALRSVQDHNAFAHLIVLLLL